MLIFPDPSVSTEYTDPNGSVWEFNGTGWVRQCDCTKRVAQESNEEQSE